MSPIDYAALIPDAQKRSILEQRLAQFASEAWQHCLNKDIAIASDNTEGAAQSDAALAILDVAITVHQDELAKLDAAVPAVTDPAPAGDAPTA